MARTKAKAKAKKTVLTVNDIPTSKTKITKAFMLEYVKVKATEEQKAEFTKFAKANTKDNDIDLKVVREKFCELFFPQLSAEGKKNKKTFLESLEEL